jgi:type VI secretion system protein ImpJ
MALTPEIHWEDGGLLRPQHLQAFQRHCHGLIAQHALSRSFGYGIRSLRIREQSVTNWMIEVESCEVLLPDGSIVVAGETAQLSPENFRYREEEGDSLYAVWLVVPFFKIHAPNVTATDNEEERGRRFVVHQVAVPDENDGSNPQSVGFKSLNARLVVGPTPPTDHVSLKIAEIKKVIVEGEEGRRYELSRDFVPACLCMDASPQICAIVNDIKDAIESKNKDLLGHLGGDRHLLTGDSLHLPATLLKLQATNSVLPVLQQINAQHELHPFDVYLHLCRLVGDLAIFGDEWEPPTPVHYEHENPLHAFREIKKQVLNLIERAFSSPVERTPFTYDEQSRMWSVEVPEHYMDGQLLVGVETSEYSDREIEPLFAEGRTVVASPLEMPLVRRARIEGVPCRYDREKLHPSLRDRDGVIFLTIEREGDFWPAVQTERMLCLSGEAAVLPDVRFYVYAAGLKE